jgi:O-antigen ligase
VGFRLSITHNILVSLGAFMFLLLARETPRPRMRVACMAMAAICAHNVLFIVIGRTGYVVLAVLLTYFILNAIVDRRHVLMAFLALTALFASAYVGSDHFSARMQDIVSDLTQWRPEAGDKTSVGQRIGYYRTTLQIIAEHPITGVGSGGFARAYAEKVKGTDAQATVNPHNDYLMLAAQAGLPALLLLLALYVLLWREAPRLATRLERDALRGLVLTIAIAGLFNSALMDHVEGLLFAWGAAVALASRRPAVEAR